MTLPKPDIIDVSDSQDPRSLDWPRIGAAGIVAGYARAGEAGRKDPCCDAHCAGLASITRLRGVYWAWHVDLSPEEQAEALVAAHKDNECELAPVFDVEVPNSHFSPDEFSARLMRSLLRADALLSGGQRAAIYTSDGFWSQHFPGANGWPFRNRMLWVANYGAKSPAIPFPWDEYSGWQFAANTIWSDGSFGKHPKDPAAHVVAEPGVIDGTGGQEVDLSVLGNCSIQNLADGVQPASLLDYADDRDRQRALRRLGFDCGLLDGKWGPRSRAALTAAQKKLGIPEDGVWGPEVEEALDAITKR